MKAIDKDTIIKKNMIKYVQTEKKILSYMNHPFIVKLNYAFQTTDKLFLLMDYCPNGDLEMVLNKVYKLPEKVARLYVAEIVLALEALHKACIIYRDLKPSNIVIDQ